MIRHNKTATIYLIGSLNHFINTDAESNGRLTVRYELSPSLKDIVEAKGVPHSAIFKVDINGKDGSLSDQLTNGDKIKVYPFEYVNAQELDSIFTSPQAFVSDVDLGKFTKTLRLLGFDTLCNSWSDQQVVETSNNERRMILTRDRELLKRRDTRFGYWVRSTDPDQQIYEIFQRFDLTDYINPFSRCMVCNGLLDSIPLEDVANKVPPKVQQWHEQFFQCRHCEKVYWKGSHYKKLNQKVSALTELS